MAVTIVIHNTKSSRTVASKQLKSQHHHYETYTNHLIASISCYTHTPVIHKLAVISQIIYRNNWGTRYVHITNTFALTYTRTYPHIYIQKHIYIRRLPNIQIEKHRATVAKAKAHYILRLNVSDLWVNCEYVYVFICVARVYVPTYTCINIFFGFPQTHIAKAFTLLL